MLTFPLIKTLLVSFAVVFMSGLPVLADQSPDGSATGFWLTQDKDGVVEIYPCEGYLCGRFHWLKEDSLQNPSLDDKNPNPALRTRPLCGMQFLGGFEPQSQGSYTGGWIYSPRHGSKFSARISLKNPDLLELHGYMFIPFLGDSQLWTRAGTHPRCETALTE